MPLTGKRLLLMMWLVGLMLWHTSPRAQNFIEHYEQLPLTKQGAVGAKAISQLVRSLFVEFTGLDEELSIFCTNDSRLTADQHMWYCEIVPHVAIRYENGKEAPYGPDQNTWTMTVDLVNNTYDLKRNWVHHSE